MDSSSTDREGDIGDAGHVASVAMAGGTSDAGGEGGRGTADVRAMVREQEPHKLRWWTVVCGDGAADAENEGGESDMGPTENV